jgi:hypothetical protein
MNKNKGFDWSPYIAIAACIAFLFFLWYGAYIASAIYKYMSQHYLKFIYALGILILVLLIIKILVLLIIKIIKIFKRARENRMLDRLMMDADEKEFAKITRDLCREKYISLKAYFKATSTFESANNFLKSCRGVSFLDAYKKEIKIDNIIISKLILDTERDEQIVSCAVDILKTYII